MSSLSGLMDEHDIKQIEEISNEYGRVMDWFEQEYPEGNIRLDIHADTTKGTIEYQLSVLTGKEATPNNQGHFVSRVTLDHSRFTDLVWISRFKRGIFENYKKQISRAVNEHYKQEKEKAGH